MSRFKELRKKAGLTQEALINQFNLKYGKKYTPAAISQFENDKRIPETQSLMDFANFFGVTVEYLLARSSDNTCFNRSYATELHNHKRNLDISPNEHDMLLAYRKAPNHITKAIDTLLRPYKAKIATANNTLVAEHPPETDYP